jgi:uncharacterized protein YcaQ
MAIDLKTLRRYAVARSLFEPTTLSRAIARLGFVQADPIRAPARAQDLTLRLRVAGYRAGDLERRYSRLAVEEDFFINYGFLPSRLHALMHPRPARAKWQRRIDERRARELLEFVRERTTVHPREVDAHFGGGRVKNYWGGSSSATTHLLDHLHYRGLLRVVRRDGGIRIYGAPRWPEVAASAEERLDALVDAVVGKYAPLPGASLSMVVGRLRYAAPQHQAELKAALQRARLRLASARVDGVDWFWPVDENPARFDVGGEVRLLAPFDPVVWDRRRFELLWGWRYRFEAYTPAAKRKLGYYALPLLWRDQVIGWANATAGGFELGFVAGKRPRDRGFTRELEAEQERFRESVR